MREKIQIKNKYTPPLHSSKFEIATSNVKYFEQSASNFPAEVKIKKCFIRHTALQGLRFLNL